MNSGIYSIHNISNNKRYIGQSRNLKVRLRNHLWRLTNNTHWNKYLQKSFNKHGHSNFKFEILENVEEIDLDEREVYWIDYFKTMNYRYGYNDCSGGNKNKKFSDKLRQYLSDKRKGIKFSESHKLNMSLAGKKKVFSEEHKKSLKEAMLRVYKNGTRKSWNKGLTKETDVRVLNNYKLRKDVSGAC